MEASDNKHADTTQAGELDDNASLDLDQAYDFLAKHVDVAALDENQMKRLTRKIDWCLLPVLFGVYFIQALDKQLLNVGGSTHRAHFESTTLRQTA
jgi:hypothetical protein